MSYAIQRIADGKYETSDPASYTADPHRAFQFVSRVAAQQYRYMLADDHRVVTLPDTRSLLSEPQPRVRS